jgi:hypothetical protein
MPAFLNDSDGRCDGAAGNQRPEKQFSQRFLYDFPN